ncbi:hypothetical protein AMS68_004523 [Peltaster fructicola]|uniref:Uncharacterized protein n=1 Tax=Peltaster fructicola TaxID=286661 RepID=A0A6H0XWE6_9PEZI|nr:hypothetical protein AMS68_004523 [Peltaster fructicola]
MTGLTDLNTTRLMLVYGAFPALAGIGWWGTMHSTFKNGLWRHLTDLVRGTTEAIPNTKQKLIRKWTGIRPLDDYLSLYLAFFLSGSRGSPVMALQNRYFVSQYAVMWSLIQLQCHRKESSALIQSSLLFTGFAVQSIGAAPVVPVWCAAHLATSLLSGAPTQFGGISKSRIAAIPASVMLSIFTPLIMSPLSRSALAAQSWINMWQVYYLFSDLFERLIAVAFTSSTLSPAVATSRLYSFAIGLATVSHALVVGVVLLSKIAPKLPTGYDHISFIKIFWPRLRLEKAGDMFEARLHFLRWDLAISALSILLWAVACYVLALPPGTAMTMSDASRLGVKIFARVCFTGPAGAAAWLLRERDLLLSRNGNAL